MNDPHNVMACELRTVGKYATYAFLGELVTQNMPLDYCSFVNSVYFVVTSYLIIIIFLVDMEAVLRLNVNMRAEGVRIGTDAGLGFVGWLLSQALFRILSVPYFDDRVPFSPQLVTKQLGYYFGFIFVLLTGFVVTLSIAAVVRFTHNAGLNLYRIIRPHFGN